MINKSLLNIVDPHQHPNEIVELVFNKDDLSLFTLSNLQVRLILCQVYMKTDVYKPFTTAVYTGHSNPKDPNEYFKQYDEELNVVLFSGIQVKDVHMCVSFKYFICDRPARSYLNNTVGHSVTESCKHCHVIGKKIDDVMTFSDLDAKELNDIFQQFTHPKYHNGPTILYM